MEVCSMKALSLGLLLAIITLSSAHAQRSPRQAKSLSYFTIELDAEIVDRAFDLGMLKQELDGQRLSVRR
jgi:hypothetical protein